MKTESQIFCEDCCREYGAGDSIFPMSPERMAQITTLIIDGEQWKICCPRCSGTKIAVNVRLVAGLGRPNL